ncbi:MAG: hypothetical protein BGO29_12090 [Bacteroidales bacterium 36-12]|nr:MAG: hypothetical protein BGO29_12090 [Bacteroidales bacterium 36-12]
MKKTLLIVLTAFLFLNCEKSNIAEHADFIGVCTNVDANLERTLEVTVGGRSFYEERKNSGNSYTAISYNGPFVLNDSILKIGFKKLIINEAPTMSGGIWYLTMDNLEYKKK